MVDGDARLRAAARAGGPGRGPARAGKLQRADALRGRLELERRSGPARGG